MLAKDCMAGRLRFFIKNWECLTKDRWVLTTVLSYQIPFTHILCQRSPPQWHVTEGECSFILSLTELGAIREEVQPQNGAFYLTLFTDPIINLKVLTTPPLQDGGYTDSQGHHLSGRPHDLKDAYFMVPVVPQHQKFLSFQ